MTMAKKVLGIVLIALFSMVIGTTTYADAEIPASEFEDENFYNYVMENYDSNGDGVLMESEAQAVTSMSVDSFPEDIEFVSFNGLEYFVSLTELNLSGTVVSDLSFLYSMPNIEKLSFNECGSLVNYEPITACDNLNEFNAYGNKNVDLSVLSGKQIRKLILGNSSVLNHSTIEEFDLVEINISGAYIDILSHLGECTGLEKISVSDIYNEENQDNDWSVLSNCKKLNYVYFSDCCIKDISWMRSLTELEHVRIQVDSITDITPLVSSAGKLKYLYLDFNNITDISCLANMKNLVQVTLRENTNLTEMPDLTNLTKLQHFYANLTGITLEQARDNLADGVRFINSNGEYLIESSDDNDNQGDDNNVDDEERTISSLSDENITVEGVLDKDTYLEGFRIVDTTSYQNIIDEIYHKLGEMNELRLYDITLYKDIIENSTTVKVKMQPNSQVKVTIKVRDMISGTKCLVYRREDDGTLTELVCYVDGQNVSFYSDHFSIFTLVISKFFGEGSSYIDDGYIYDNDDQGVSDIENEDTIIVNDSGDSNGMSDDTTTGENKLKEDENNKKDYTRNEQESNNDEENKKDPSNDGKNTVTKVIVVAVVVSVVVLDIIAYEVYVWEGKKSVVNSGKDINENSI